MASDTCIICRRRSGGARLCPLCRKHLFLYYLPPVLAGMAVLLFLLLVST